MTEKKAREEEIRRLEKAAFWDSYRTERIRLARERGIKKANQVQGLQGFVTDLNAALERLFSIGELPKKKKPSSH
jgi:hypothetical protein